MSVLVRDVLGQRARREGVSVNALAVALIESFVADPAGWDVVQARLAVVRRRRAIPLSTLLSGRHRRPEASGKAKKLKG